MKKLLFSLGVMIAATVSTATAATGNYFISGNFNEWSHAQLQFEQKGTEYSITLDGSGLQNFAGEFLICGGTKGSPDWNDKIGGVSNIVADKEYTYTVGGGNCTINGIIAYPLTVSFDTATRKLMVSGAAAENEYSTVYVIGDFGDSWSETRTDGPLTLKEGTNNVWEGDITFAGANNYFKLKAGAYVYGTGGGDIAVTLGETYTASQSGNAFSLAKGTYHFEYVLDKNADTGRLTVTGNGDDPVPPTPTDYTGWYLNVQGDFNGWNPEGVAFNADGTVEAKNLKIGTGEFELKIWDGKGDSYWGNQSATIVSGEPVTVYNGGGHMTISGATAESVYNITYNAETQVMVATLVGGDTPEPPTPGVDYTTWYVNVVGNFNEWTDNGINPNAEGLAEHKDLAIGNSGFKVKVWNGKDVWYSYDKPIVVGEPTAIYEDIYDMAPMTIAGATEGEKYNVTFDCATSTLTVTKVETPVGEVQKVYNDGEIALGLNAYAWHAAGMNFLAENPTGGDTKVYSFKADNAGADASMGLFANGKEFVTGKLNSAKLNYKWYAVGSAKCTVRLTAEGGDEQNYTWTVNEENAGKWNTTSISVAENFPTVAEQWKNFQGKGAGYVFSIVLEEASENFCLYFDNINYSNLDETWVAPEIPEIVPPTYVPSIEQPKDEVLSIFSEYGNNNFGIGPWGQATQYEVVTIDGKEAAKLTNFNYLGWELNPAVNVKDYKYVHVDFYPCEETTFGFTIISPGHEKAWIAPEVKLNEWNSYDVPVSYWENNEEDNFNVDKTNVFQIKFDQGKKVEAYLANVYFYGDASVITPVEPGNGKTSKFEYPGVAEQEGKSYPYTFVIEVTYNEDRTLTIVANYVFTEAGAPYGMVPGSVILNGFHDFAETAEGRTYTTTDTFEAGQKLNIETYIPAGAGVVLSDKVEYTVGAEDVVSGVAIVAVEEAPVYFNLEGVRVANPTQGLFIKVQNGKASKVVVK